MSNSQLNLTVVRVQDSITTNLNNTAYLAFLSGVIFMYVLIFLLTWTLCLWCVYVHVSFRFLSQQLQGM